MTGHPLRLHDRNMDRREQITRIIETVYNRADGVEGSETHVRRMFALAVELETKMVDPASPVKTMPDKSARR